jgi:hypothetical protein
MAVPGPLPGTEEQPSSFFVSDHDLLVRTDMRVKQLFDWMKRHEKEHAAVATAIAANRKIILAAGLTAAGSAVGVILNFFLRK